MSLDITIHPLEGEPIDIDNVSYLSLVNDETFGKAPVVSESNYDGRLVVFVNPSNVLAIEASE